MKQNFIQSVFLFLALGIFHTARTQTYTISGNKNWSATGAPSYCSGCTFNISTGVTLTLDQSWVTCYNCTFNGGIIVDNAPFTWQGATIKADSVAINSSSASFQIGPSGGATFTNGKLAFNAATTCQACMFTNETIHINTLSNTDQVTLQASSGYNTSALTNTTVTVDKGILYENIATSLTNTTLTVNNSASVKSDNGTVTLSNSNMFLNGNATFSTTAAFVLKNNSEVIVGDGALASHASFYDGSGTNLVMQDNSMIRVSNANNTYQNWGNYTYIPASGPSKSYTTTSNGFNCGTPAYPNSCTANYVYGCATLNSAGALACTLLAITTPDLSVALTGTNAVTLSWAAGDNSTADHFLVERSLNGLDWTTIGTVAADRYFTGEYQFSDPAAEAGTDYYRLQVIDKDGGAIYSKVSTVSIDHVPGAISIYPNPATGHTFFIRTASADPILVNIFNLSGQLLFRTSLKGQMVYPIILPASVTSGNYIVVQVISRDKTQAFNLLNQ
jgi:hypothetical protein